MRVDTHGLRFEENPCSQPALETCVEKRVEQQQTFLNLRRRLSFRRDVGIASQLQKKREKEKKAKAKKKNHKTKKKPTQNKFSE